MITLYSFGPGFGLPDPSPFVTKVEVLLKMSKLPYRTDTTGFTKAPKGKLPYIEDDGVMVSDSAFIRWHIEQKYRIDFDQGLDASQKAIAWAFEKMLEDQLYWVMIDDRWMDDANFRRGPATFFERLPAVIRPIVVAMTRRKLRATLQGQGIGRHSPDEISRWRRARSMRSLISSATSRFSWAASRPASTPPCSLSCAGCCPHTSRREPARRLSGTTICAVMWAA